MNYKFVLYNEALGTYEIKRAPEGWDALAFTFKRSKEYHGVAIEYTFDLGFLSDGKDFIQSVYNTFGIEGFIRLTVYEFEPNATKWQEAYTGRVNLHKLKLSSLKATTNIEQSGVVQKFLNLDTVAVSLQSLSSISGAALPAVPLVTIPLHSQEIVKKYEAWANPEQGTINSPIVSEAGARSATIILGFDVPKINELNAYTYATGFFLDDEVLPIIETVERGPFTVEYQISAIVKAFKEWDGGAFGKGDFNSAQLQIFYRISQQAPVRIYNHIDNTVGGTFESFVNVNGNFTADLEIGDQVYLYGVIDVWDITGNVLGDYEFMYDINLQGNSFIKILARTQTSPTLARGVMVYEFLNGLASAITDQPDAFFSSYYGRTDSYPRSYEADGPGSKKLVTNGFQIRNFPITEKPIFSSAKDAYEALAAVDNVGLGFELKAGKMSMVVEALPYFYKQEIGLVLGVVTDLTKRPATEYMYNTASFGYEKWQTEDYGGLDEFNTKKDYVLPITQLKNELRAVSKFNAAGYLIEAVRREQYIDSNTKDNGSDNDLFLICVLRKPGGGYETERNQVINITGVESPGTTYNARIAPARIRKNHEHKLRSSLLKMPNKTINFSFGSGNYRMATQLPGEPVALAENESPLVKSLAAPIWGDEIYEFSHPLTAAQLQIVRQDPYKKIQFQDENYNIKTGWLIEIKSEKEEKLTDFVLLQSYEAPRENIAVNENPINNA